MKTTFKFDTPLTPIDRVVEGACCAVVVGMILSAIIFYGKLPDVIPIHYNAHGIVDDYGTKLYIFGLPILALVIYVGMTIIPFQSKLFVHKISGGKIRYFRFVKLCVLVCFALIQIKTLLIALA